ncbi:MAG TPA: type II secretion system F family protein [Tepidisphaeraceae bacterium]|jgi:tight adherence protein C|nr:type II secretion system F family protein [Tepidisphaeraceae bacterium]
MIQQFMFILSIFGAVAAIAYALFYRFFSRDDARLRTRLAMDNDPAARHHHTASVGVKPILERIGKAAAEPFMPKTREKQSIIRRQLGFAGIYSPSAIKLIVGCKVICLCAGLIGGFIIGNASDNLMLGLSLGGIAGYAIPAVWLRFTIRHNQKELNFSLPDALDLMVVCVEAGLTIDAAMQRVGNELALAHPRLSREFAIAHMETRVGLSRSESLRNLGTRTGAASIQSLVAMLIQADRFGTSIGSALRVHADSLRSKRQHEAEEMAGKASVKMTFPLVLFIFPATFIVLAGPTILQLMKSSFFNGQ